MREPQTRTKYTYDTLDRLTRAVTTGSSNYPSWGLSETYDRYSNRSLQAVYSGCTGGVACPTNTVTPDAATNRLSGDCYDSTGNLMAESTPPCPSPTYTYDAENRTVNYLTAAYAYDGNNLRVQKSSGSTSTVYIFSGSKVIAEYDNNAAVNSPSREYIYSGSSLLAKADSTGVKYYHRDHLSNRLVTDSSGNIAAQLGHFPFGESWYNATNDKLLFSSYERDSESGSDYAVARYDVSRLGRFSSPDRLAGSRSDPQSLNRYAYSLNDPVNLTDPLGMRPHRPNRYPGGAGCYGSNSGGGIDEGGSGGGCGTGGDCTMDGFSTPCSVVLGSVGSGAAVQCPQNNCNGIGGVDRNGFFRYVQDHIDYLCAGSSIKDFSCIFGPRGRQWLRPVDPLEVYFSSEDARINFTFAQVYNATIGDIEQGLKSGAAVAGPAAIDAAVDIAASALEESGLELTYASRIEMRSREDIGPNHNFPGFFDADIVENGTIIKQDGNYIEYGLSGYQMGTRASQAGVYEIGGYWAGDNVFYVTHRFFRPN
jgi:RHS repeat-associated protein